MSFSPHSNFSFEWSSRRQKDANQLDANTSRFPMTMRAIAAPERRPTYPGRHFQRLGPHIGDTTNVTIETWDFGNWFVSGYFHGWNGQQTSTYFVGEIIGPRYQFLSRRNNWNEEPLWDQMTSFVENTHDCIFMRWRTMYTIPEPSGGLASNQTCYYVCMRSCDGKMNIVSGSGLENVVFSPSHVRSNLWANGEWEWRRRYLLFVGWKEWARKWNEQEMQRMG